MGNVLTSQPGIADRPRPKKNYLNETKGIKSWLTTVDHKRLGVMYLIGVLSAFFLGGMFALLIRLTLLTPKHMLFGQVLMTAETYNRVFTLHGAIMVFVFIIPSVPAAFGNFVMPLMLGAKAGFFQRLNLGIFFLCSTATMRALCSMFLGAVDTGWIFNTPNR